MSGFQRCVLRPRRLSKVSKGLFWDVRKVCFRDVLVRSNALHRVFSACLAIDACPGPLLVRNMQVRAEAIEEARAGR
jgi:hypothetical protein